MSGLSGKRVEECNLFTDNFDYYFRDLSFAGINSLTRADEGTERPPQVLQRVGTARQSIVLTRVLLAKLWLR